MLIPTEDQIWTTDIRLPRIALGLVALMISWHCKKQATVALLSAEAEDFGLSGSAQEVMQEVNIVY